MKIDSGWWLDVAHVHIGLLREMVVKILLQKLGFPYYCQNVVTIGVWIGTCKFVWLSFLLMHLCAIIGLQSLLHNLLKPQKHATQNV